MKFLDQPPRFLFFTGKGGVGKTSIACATAIHLAERDQRVLLVSTDPASNVGQVFGISIGNQVTPVTKVPNLSALEIDPQAAAQAYRDRIVGPVRGLLPEAVVKGIEEQLSGACTTEIAAFDEFTALLIDGALTNAFDHIVFDTAPTGHTIRMLQLPGAWSGFLEEGKGDASCLGPLAGLEKQRTQYKAAVEALSDAQKTRLVLVARAQAATLNEAARTHGELAAIGLSQQYLVINGVFPESETAGDPLAQAIYKREQAVLKNLPEVLRQLPIDHIELKAFNLFGLAALKQLLNATPATEVVAVQPSKLTHVHVPGLGTLVAYHRDVARQMGASGHFITPMMQLQDPKQTKVLIVTLAETTPVLEAANLQADLRRAGIEPWAWVINNSVAAAQVSSPLLLQRAHNELREIEAVTTQHASRYALVPLLKDEPVGATRLSQMAANLS